MKLLTLGSFLNGAESRIRELMGVLLSGIRLHAVGQDEGRRGEFQSELGRIEEGISNAQKAESISLLVGQAIHCIDAYHRSVDSDNKVALSEYKQLAVALTQTVARMATGTTESIEKLRSIEKHMGAVNSVGEIRLLRHALSSYLTELCEKTVQHREDATRLVSTLQHKLQQNTSPRLLSVDALPNASHAAGLSGRADALESIRQATQAHTCSYAAAMLIDRFALMSKRFGNVVVDRVQDFVSLEIAQKLQVDDQLFEWTPGGFVVVLERTEPLERIQFELKQLSTIKANKAIEVDNRSVVLPISISFRLFPLFQASSAEAVQMDIDSFISAHF